MITYTPLWETMKQRRITIYALIKNDSFSRGTLDSLKHNRNITTATLNDLCRILLPRGGCAGLYSGQNRRTVTARFRS